MPPCGEASLSPSPLRPALGKSGRMWTFRLRSFWQGNTGRICLSVCVCFLGWLSLSLGARVRTFFWQEAGFSGHLSGWRELCVGGGGGFWLGVRGLRPQTQSALQMTKKENLQVADWVCKVCMCVCAHGFPSPSQPMKVSTLWMAIKTQPVSQAGAI